MTDEKSLLERFTAGDHIAFRELFMRYHLKVYYFVLGLLKSERDAEDLTQDIFLKLWIHRSYLTEVRTFGSYLYVLSKNMVFNHLASHVINFDDIQKIEEENGLQSETPYDEMVAKDLQLLVDMIVETMPQQRKKIYKMSRNEGLSNTEIAEKLQVSKKTVENHLNLALKELRNAVLTMLVVMMC